jgi:CDP-glucose 4,6-dehydratase
LAVRTRTLEALGLSRVDPSFWAGRRVLLTGHTGFKGAWAALWLTQMGAKVTGLALPPDTDPNLFTLAKVEQDIDSKIADIRDRERIAALVEAADPELVLHMAAQPLVRRAVREPVQTFAINILGTVHLLEALRRRPALVAVLAVTTDKVYENLEQGLSFAEGDPLGGREPYSASKAATEIAVAAMAGTYFDAADVPVATARAGNVIGGGDFADDRLIPDLVRAVAQGVRPVLRNPLAIRPWHYVLDCLAGYFCFLQSLATKKTTARRLNFGPATADVDVQTLAGSILVALGASPQWDLDPSPSLHESRTLKLDTRQSRKLLGWQDHFCGSRGLQATAAWYLAWKQGRDMRATTLVAIDEFMSVQDRAGAEVVMIKSP